MYRTQLPTFVWAARPLEIPPALLELAPESYVRISNGKGGTGTVVAGDYIKELREMIERQSNGFYTVQEASHIFADSVGGISAMHWQAKMNDAYLAGKLVGRDATTVPKISSSAYLGWSDLVKDTDLDAWLVAVDSRHRFPQATRPQAATPVPVGGLDYSLLATPDELLDAFGKWGMDIAWFDDLNSRKWLFDARRKKGQGQKGQVLKPLFCPFAVMNGLIGKVRKNKRLQPDTAWRTLEHKFPRVYSTFESHDPRDRTGD